MDAPNYDRYGNWMAAAITLGVFIVIVAFALTLMPIHGQICHETKTGQEQCASYNVIPVALWHVKEALSSVSDVITAIATALLVFVTWRLVKLGGDQSRTTRAELRAYVKIDSSDDSPIVINIGQKISASISTVNVGQTPANYVHSRFTIFFTTFPLFESLLVHGAAEEIDSQVTVFPNQTFRQIVMSDNSVTQADVTKILNDPTYRLCMFGEVSYTDVFGEEHQTKCRMVTRAVSTGPFAFVYCDEGNEAD